MLLLLEDGKSLLEDLLVALHERGELGNGRLETELLDVVGVVGGVLEPRSSLLIGSSSFGVHPASEEFADLLVVERAVTLGVDRLADLVLSESATQTVEEEGTGTLPLENLTDHSLGLHAAWSVVQLCKLESHLLVRWEEKTLTVGDE